ncbi:hypothetical protein [Mycobacterium leprae]|uniref:hypothetical protein n=1 Tax=Mycobacterium leprae TaxID=1769 RepID=UPI0011AE86B1|nr:hypothetical protein [Mycobacterium leprae]
MTFVEMALGKETAAPSRIRRMWLRAPAHGLAGLLVADLISMWEGLLCEYLLARDYAIAVQVESPCRPDGTPSSFFGWINSEKVFKDCI